MIELQILFISILSLLLILLILFAIIFTIFLNKVNPVKRIHCLVRKGRYFHACREIVRLLSIPPYPTQEMEIDYALRCIALNRTLLIELEQLCYLIGKVDLLESIRGANNILENFIKVLNNKNAPIEGYIQDWNEAALQFYKLKYKMLRHF